MISVSSDVRECFGSVEPSMAIKLHSYLISYKAHDDLRFSSISQGPGQWDSREGVLTEKMTPMRIM